jgi:hypothetical protein
MSLNLERAWAVDNARMIRDAVSVVLQEGKELSPMAEAAMVGPASEVAAKRSEARVMPVGKALI